MTWDEYFIHMCDIVALNSKCLSRQIGTVLVRDRSVVSTGYNGPPVGVPHCDVRHKTDKYLMELYKAKEGLNIRETDKVTTCPRRLLEYKSGEGLHLCPAGHAERNALINAAKDGVSTKGCKLYMNCGIPCAPCLIEIINAGVGEIIVTSTEFYDPLSEWILSESKLKVTLCVVERGEQV